MWESTLFHSGISENKLILKCKLVVLLYCKHLCPETNFSYSQWKWTLPMCAGPTLEKCLELFENVGMKHFPLEKDKLLKLKLFRNGLLSKNFWFWKKKKKKENSWDCPPPKKKNNNFFWIERFHFCFKLDSHSPKLNILW